MTSKPQFKSDAFEAIHSAVSGMFAAGTIDEATMHKFDDACIRDPADIAPAKIKKIREKKRVSGPSSRAISTRAKARARSSQLIA